MAARGEPMIWLMGLALIICFIAVVALVGQVLLEGARTFWPRPIERVVLAPGDYPGAGRVFFGIPISREAFDAPPDLKARLDAMTRAGTLPAGALAPDGRPIRVQYRAGNRDLADQSFLWVNAADIQSASRADETVLLERREWGIFLGTPEAIFRQVEVKPDAPPTPPHDDTFTGKLKVERVALADGKTYDRVYLTEGQAQTRAALPAFIREAADRRERIRKIDADEIGDINHAMVAGAVEQRRADRLLDAGARNVRRPSPALWAGLLAALALTGWGARTLARRRSLTEHPPLARLLLARACLVLALAAGLGVVVERPWRSVAISPEEHAAVTQHVREQAARLQADYDAADARKKKLQQEDAQWRVLVMDAGGQRFAPLTLSEHDQPMKLSLIVRAVNPNDLSWPGKLRVYLARWSEFLTDDPREQNTEGGVFPVIFGTVLLTLLLSIVVVPFGVIAALYLREYARQGLVTSILRISINNLAGVPSIVFGMFGLGFFRYTLGEYIDKGPAPAERAPVSSWWVWVLGAGVIVLAALVSALFARPTPGQPAQRRHRLLASLTVCLWLAAGAAAVLLAAHTPYFDGFFASRPDATFGKPGLLWAAMTLALLTLPVVIVSTEEAVAAVPRTMREGSYGCGASKWQTIRRIVLPGAMPGIMTGMILAMARGAGEVAPLMLVGAMKVAPELPFSSHFPFLRPERSFMHLGFHIYDLGFQSPDAEAARPLVWTTTLLLISIVVFLNLAAILIRARLKARSSGSAV